MKIFDDMTFSGSPEALRNLIQRLDQTAQIGPWQRDPESEQSHVQLGVGPDTTRCFRMKDGTPSPAALLWLVGGEKGNSGWNVTNIIPAAPNDSLSEGAYHALLTSFREATLPFAREAGVSISIPRLDVGPENWLSPRQQELLETFSRNANRSTGAAHPNDRKRWNAFVIAVHREGSNLGEADLQRILIEHEHWPEAAATKLAVLFEQERALLSDLAKTA